VRNRQLSGARGAFTLIEVLIVIAILLAIGGLVVVNLLPTKDKADVDLQIVQFDSIGRALDQFKLDMKRYPSTEEGLTVLWNKSGLENEDDAQSWRGPYMQDPITKDNWNKPLVYRFPGEIRGEQYYDLISSGPDGQEGTEDDISNHDRHKGEDGEFESAEDESFTPPTTESGGG
jgi:general secretion pathway protein G